MFHDTANHKGLNQCTTTREKKPKHFIISVLTLRVCLRFVNVQLVLSFSCLRRAQKRGLPPFTGPEPIIMASPQGSIHFNYHPLRGVCVRRPGKHFDVLGKVTDRRWDFSGNGDIWARRCENWDVFRFGRDLVEHVVLVKPRRSRDNICSTCCEVIVCACVCEHAVCICLKCV